MSQRTIAVPAGALSYAHDQGFELMSNGIEWPYDGGAMTFTVPRPRDHVGGKVTVRLFFKCKDGPDGDHRFFVTPMTFNSGNGFETYSDHGTPAMNIRSGHGNVYATSVDIPPGNGWGTGDWWYFRINRGGTYRTNILMMSVGVDYNTTKPLPGRLPLPRGLATRSRKAPAKAVKAPAKTRKPAKKRR